MLCIPDGDGAVGAFASLTDPFILISVSRSVVEGEFFSCMAALTSDSAANRLKQLLAFSLFNASFPRMDSKREATDSLARTLTDIY